MPLIFKGQTDTQRFRTWGAVGAAAVGVVGSAVMNRGNKNSNGGAGTQTVDKAPWAAAQPWIQNQLSSGQALQNQYTNAPFNPQQQAAYNNSYAQSDYMRSLVPSLLDQMQHEPLGYDVNNPNARATAFDWKALAGGLGGGGGAGGTGSMSYAQMQADAEARAAAERNAQKGAFTQFDISKNPIAGYYGAFLGMPNYTDGGKGIREAFTSALGDAGGAGYGEFKYGMGAPEKGTKAYRDMNEYFSYGGNDPFDLYGRMDRSALQPPAPGYTPAGGA